MDAVTDGNLPRDLVPVEQAAIIAGVSTPTLWRAVRAGQITAYPIGLKAKRFSMAEVKNWGDERRQAVASRRRRP